MKQRYRKWLIIASLGVVLGGTLIVLGGTLKIAGYSLAGLFIGLCAAVWLAILVLRSPSEPRG